MGVMFLNSIQTKNRMFDYKKSKQHQRVGALADDHYDLQVMKTNYPRLRFSPNNKHWTKVSIRRNEITHDYYGSRAKLPEN